MRHLLLLSVLVVSALPSVAVTQDSGSAPAGIYVALGDSIAAGIGSSLPRKRSYPALVRAYMETQLGETVMLENLAVPGATATSFLTGNQIEQFREVAVEAEAAGLPVLAVTVTLGGNEVLDLFGASDTDRQSALDEFSASYGAALAEIRAIAGTDTPIAVTTIYDPTGQPTMVEGTDAWWIARFNDVITNEAASHGMSVADLAEPFTDDLSALTRYPVDPHPTNTGHELISMLVWGALEIDTVPPVIEIESPQSAARQRPTLRFRASEPLAPETIRLSSNQGVTIFPPVDVAENTYAALMIIHDSSIPEISIAIGAFDRAGNHVAVDHTVTVATDR